MISKKVEDALLEDLNGTNAKLEQCREHQKKTRGEQRRKLERIETFLEARRLRIAICIDILNGRAFTVHEESDVQEVDGEAPALTVAKPSPSQAKLVDLMEKMGGKVTNYHVGEREAIE